jgi:hypothetical protein
MGIFISFFKGGTMEILKNRRAALTFLFVLVYAAGFPQAGTEFWLTIPELTQTHGVIWNQGGLVKHIVVSTFDAPATVTATVPADRNFRPITIEVPPNTTERISLEEYNDMLAMAHYDSITKQGILVQSSDIITAYMESMEANNPDIFTLKGRHSLGTEFFTPFQDKAPNNGNLTIVPYSSIDIVATEDGTTVTIVPTKAAAKRGGGSYLPGETITVVLNRGETYSVRALEVDADAHLGGTHIKSNKPIAVMCKDDSVYIDSNFDLNGDQLVPVNRTGSQYIVMKGGVNAWTFGGANEWAFIVPTQDGTEVKVNGTVLGVYDAGEQVSIPISLTYTVIESDAKPFYCYHLVAAKGEIGGALLPPTDQCSGSTRAGFSYSYGEYNSDQGQNQELYILIMVRTGAEDAFLLDGAPAAWITPASFESVSEFWSAAKFGPLNNTILEEGPHVITNSKDLFHMGYINTTGSGVLYGYFSDFESQEVSALAVKNNERVAAYCVGEDIRLRVDGGVNYKWKAFITGNESADRTHLLSATNVYNPAVSSAIAKGEYTFVVEVGNACGKATVSDTVFLEIVDPPVAGLASASFCEGAVGSGCAAGIDLSAYENALSGGQGLTALSWRREVFDEMALFLDFETKRELAVSSPSLKVLSARDNPAPDAVNPSSRVMRYEYNDEIAEIIFRPRAELDFDFSKGSLVSFMLHRKKFWNQCTDLDMTISFVHEASATEISIDKKLLYCNEWEEHVFDFSSFGSSLVFDYAKITFHVEDGNNYFYIDNFRKFISYRVEDILFPENAQLCGQPKLFVLMEAPNGCQVSSVLEATVSPASFSVNSPFEATICLTGEEGEGAATADITAYSADIIGADGLAAGNTIVKWEGYIIDSLQLFDDFDETMTLVFPGWIDRANNPAPGGINESAKVWKLSSGTAAAAFYKQLNLAEGSTFFIDLKINPSSWNTSENSIDISLLTAGGTILANSLGAYTYEHSTSTEWISLKFDFSAHTAHADVAQLQIITAGGGSFHIDNIRRLYAPIRSDLLDPTNAEVFDGARFYATVADPQGCVAMAELVIDMKACVPPVRDSSITWCEDVKESGSAAGIDLTEFADYMKFSIVANTAEWYSDAELTVPVADPADAQASNGDIFYLKVTAPDYLWAKAMLTIEILGLPDITFPEFDPVCQNNSSINIELASPAGGEYSSASPFLGADLNFDISENGLYTVRYDYEDEHGCAFFIEREINVKPQPEITVVESKLNYCSVPDAFIELEQITGADYEWYKNGLIISSETNNKIENLTAGVYTGLITVDGCAAETGEFEVVELGLPTYEYSGSETVCYGNNQPELKITLTGTGPWELEYTDSDNVLQTATSADNVFEIPFSPSAPGQYLFKLAKLSDANSCLAIIGTDQIKYEVLPPADSPWEPGTEKEFCTNSPDISLGGYVNIAGGSFSGTGITADNFSPAAAGTGEWEIRYDYIFQSICAASSVIELVVNPVPEPVFTHKQTLCIDHQDIDLEISPDAQIASGIFSGAGVTGAQFSPSAAGSGTHTISYALESDKGCKNIYTTEITVNPLPEPEILSSSSYIYCLTQPQFQVEISPAGGTLSGSGISAGYFNPELAGAGQSTVTYNYTDANGCENTAAEVFTVNSTPQPDAAIFPFIVTDIAPTIRIEPIAGASINWYSSETDIAPISALPELEHGQTGIIEKDYWVSQQIDGCESYRTKVTLSIIDCGTPAPAIADAVRNICLYSGSQTFSATKNYTASEIRWYDASNSLLHTGDSYTFTPSGNVSIYAAQFYECEGPKAVASVSFIEPAAPQLSHSGNICQAEGFVTAQAVSGQAVHWYNSEPLYPADKNTALAFSPVFQSPEIMPAEYSVWAVAELSGCLSPAQSISFRIKPVPALPVTSAPDFICFGQDAQNISAAGTDIKWYDAITGGNHLASGSLYAPSVSLPDTYRYYASQTIEACESQRAEAIYIIRELPALPEIEDETICSNFPLPYIEATAQYPDVRWYKKITDAAPYKTGAGIQLAPGDTELYVSQFGNGCESQRESFSLTIIPQPAPPVLTAITVCQGEPSAKLVSEVPALWHADTLAAELTSGSALEINSPALGRTPYYARAAEQGCYSYFAETELNVIPQPASIAADASELESCQYETVKTFSAQPGTGNQVHWYSSTGILLETGNIFNPEQYLQAGERSTFATRQADGQCLSPATEISYMLRKLPEPPLIIHSSHCMYDAVMSAQALSQHQIQWYDFETMQAAGTNPEYRFEHKISQPGNFILAAIALDTYGCRSPLETATVPIGMVPAPIITGPDTVCAESHTLYQAAGIMSGSALSWENRQPGNAAFTPNNSGDKLNIRFLQPVADELKLTEESSLGCKGTAIKRVLVAPKPAADFEQTADDENLTLRNISVFKNANGIPGANANWSILLENGDIISMPDNPIGNKIELIMEEGEHEVSLYVTNNHGCSDSRARQLKINVARGLTVPNAVAGGHQSEAISVFAPKGKDLSSYSLHIFDAWGNLVWFTDEIENGVPARGWDCTLNGMPAAAGTYTWRIEASFRNGAKWKGAKAPNGKLKKIGTFVLIR